MKHTYILIISSLLVLILGFGCEKGPQGDVGPVGDKGPQGNAGVNNTTAGPKGQQGLQGPTGPAGQRGPSGTDGQAGVANLVITNWQKIVWKNYNTITAGTYALFGEIALPELTQRVIDKGHVEVQVRFNNDNQQISSPNYIGTNFLLNNDSYWIELHGVKLGKVVFRIDLFDVPTATFIELLNNHPIEARASILIN